MARVARPIDPRKIRILKEQIQDPHYIHDAVDSLAGRITDRLLGLDDHSPYETDHRSANSSRNDIALFLNPDE